MVAEREHAPMAGGAAAALDYSLDRWKALGRFLVDYRWIARGGYAVRHGNEVIRAAQGAQHVYQLHVELQRIVPAIWRRILVPETLTLVRLDRVIQAAMCWTNSHLHDFKIAGARYGIPNVDWPDE